MNFFLKTIIVDQAIGVKNSYENKKGDTVIVCNSKEQRNMLQAQIHQKSLAVKVKPLDERLNKTIAVAGFNPAYNKSVITTIRKQNPFFDNFLTFKGNTIDDHIKLVEVKPLNNNEKLSQAVFNVSFELRKLLAKNNDKVLFGMKSVKVYDRIFVKRCYVCQDFGHMQSSCHSPDNPICGNCGNNHRTSDCTSSVKKCVNCCKKNLKHDHAASSVDCPLFKAEKACLQALN